MIDDSLVVNMTSNYGERIRWSIYITGTSLQRIYISPFSRIFKTNFQSFFKNAFFLPFLRTLNAALAAENHAF